MEIPNITWAESRGNPNAKSQTSSALGLGQFVNGTWLDMIRRYRPDLAQGRSQAEILELRKDPVLSQQMTNAYAAENVAKLNRAGLPVTPGSTYLMHFAGPSGAIALMRADPNAPVESILGYQAVSANAFLRGKTASWVIDWANKKMAAAATPKSNVRDRLAPRDGQPVPYLAQTQAVDPAFGATNWPPRPASPNVWPLDAAGAFAGTPRVAPLPFVAAGSTEPSAGTFSGRFGTGAQFAPGSSSPPLDNPSLSAPPAGAAGDERNVRRLVRVNPKVEIGSFDPTARAALPNEVPASNPPASFDDRFGNWTSSPAASAPLTPYGPLSPPQTTRPVGLITGQPMPNIALPPSVFGLPELERADWKRRQ